MSSIKFVPGGVGSQLMELGLIEPENVRIYSPRTRDREIPVLVDVQSEIVFIDGFYVGDGEYRTAEYRESPPATLSASTGGVQDWDTERRMSQFEFLIRDKTVLDFGCGRGEFLLSAKAIASRVMGVDLDLQSLEALRTAGIPCFDSLESIDFNFETITLFHVLEHLRDPVEVLDNLRKLLESPGGRIIVEVPHARDFLLKDLGVEEFKKFTLWSQHLVLHTRESLRRIMEVAGFFNIEIRGTQRYGLANHLTWLRWGTPGGHLGQLAPLETPGLNEAYENSLNTLDRTDTLIAVASV